MMSNTYHYSLCIILLIFGDLKGCVRTRIITKSLAHIVTIFCIGFLAMHILGVTSSSLGIEWSLQYIRPAVCAIICTLEPVIMMIFQYTFLKDIKPGLHNWVEILGDVICFCGVLGGPLADFITQDG